MSEKFERLRQLLRELFQLDHPELDFGLYRIMQAKRGRSRAFSTSTCFRRSRQRSPDSGMPIGRRSSDGST